MPFFYFQTFGCQMNVSDSDAVSVKLVQHGFLATDDVTKADLIIVNTCSVRNKAEQRAKARIAEFASIKSKKSGAQLWVIGCMAERLGEKLQDEIRGIDQVIGARKLDSIDEILAHILPQRISEDEYTYTANVVSDFLPVMRGCDNYCAYCVVPYVRGPENSIDSNELLNIAKSKVTNGCKEITLLGQNVNSYQSGNSDFSDLLKSLCQIDGLERIRFTTSHPKDCSRKLIETIAENAKLCTHLHLPFQAGSDKILQLMNRKYSAEQYLEKIAMVRSIVPQMDMTTDILVGFPGETEEDFEETIELVKKVRFTTAFMFAYSVREGTAASKMVDTVTQEEKTRRLRKVIETQTAITKEIYAQMKDKKIEIMVTEQQKKQDGFWMGQDKGCKRVLVNDSTLQPGSIITRTVSHSSGMTLLCDTH